MIRSFSRILAAAAVVAVGATASACDATPRAASVGSDAIAVSQLNATMTALNGSTAGRCLLALQNPQLLGYSGVGAGGSGTFATAFAGSVLSNLIGNSLASQYAGHLGVTTTAADRAVASAQYAKVLDGEIQANLQSAGQTGASPCVTDAGTPLTGAQLLAQLPADVRAAQVASQAVDAALLAKGADLSDRAVQDYYDANRDTFTVVCMSVIATATQADADKVVNQLIKKAAFADVAAASSVDKASAAKGGQLGCTFTAARVKSALQLSSLTVGEPITPIQTATGVWAVYEVTSSTTQPVEAVRSLIRSELLRASANVQRVSRELVSFSHQVTIEVNPQYGTWRGLRIVPPASPAPRYLAPFTSAAAATAAAPSTGG